MREIVELEDPGPPTGPSRPVVSPEYWDGGSPTYAIRQPSNVW
jgi:hypothetical protein